MLSSHVVIIYGIANRVGQMVRYGVEPKRASVIHLGTGDSSTQRVVDAAAAASWTQPQAANSVREARVMWTQQQPWESNGKNAEQSGLVELKYAYCGNVYIKLSGIMYSISVRCTCSA